MPARQSFAIAPILALLLAALLLVLDVASMRHLSITYDEPRHFRYGQNILRLDSDRFDDSKMPISALNALPSAIAATLPHGSTADALMRLETGRYVTVLFSLLVAACVFFWARDLYGAAGGLLALALYVFDPNLLAHSQLVTTDVYAAGTIALALYTFWLFLRRGGSARALTAALMLGLALLSKYTAIVLFPLYAVIAVGYHWPDLRASRSTCALRFARWAALFALVSLLVVNAGFLFNRTLTPLGGYSFRSQLFRQLQHSSHAVAMVPIPVPYPYLEGLDWVMQRERTGEGYGPIYMAGQLRQGRAFNGYYFYATLFKVPLATQLLLLAAIVSYIARRRRFAFFRNEWVIACPIIFFTIYFNFFFRAQIGMRYFLVVFPLLYVFAGSLLADWPQVSRRRVRLVTAALALTAVSVISYFPHFLAYFNELVPDRTLAYRKLADSNLDWGQHRWYLARYRAAHPEAVVEPDHPQVGTILVGVNALTGVGGDVERFRWLRDNFTPIDHIAHAVLVYRVTPAALQRVALRARASQTQGGDSSNK